MSEPGTKLMTRGKVILSIAAVTVGAAMQPIHEYRTKGTVSGIAIAAASMAFCMGLAIVIGITWWANRPEREDSDE